MVLNRLQGRMERLLAPYGSASPGVSIGVVQDGMLVAQHNAGMASIELGVPIGTATTFRVASVTKQFTCAAVLALAADGRLGVDDPVGKYFPELPDYGVTLTVDHLMHASSGLRDEMEILGAGGCNIAVPIQRQDFLDGIFRQRALNFTPGSRYLYCNTNYLLLGLIVEQVSGMPLRDFLQARFFGPLGMSQTALVESPVEALPGLTTGYVTTPDGWRHAQCGYPRHAEGGLITSIPDLVRWMRKLADDAALRGGLESQFAFPNGVLSHYARGLQVTEVRGLRTVSHGGSRPGYGAEFLTVPQLGLGVIVLANSGSADPYHIGQAVLAEALADVPGVQAVPDLPADLSGYVGRFLDPATPQTVEFSLDAHGRLQGKMFGNPFRLRAGADGWLYAARAAHDFRCRLADDGGLEVVQDAGVAGRWRRVGPGTLPADLDGTYLSDEMASCWQIAGAAVRVDGPIIRTTVWRVEPLDAAHVRLVYPGGTWLDARVLRGAGGAISGMLVNGGRIKLVAVRKAA